MPGSHIFTDKVAPDTMRFLKPNLGIMGAFNFNFQRQYETDEPIGDTLRYKEPWRMQTQDGFGWNGQSIVRRNRTMTIDQEVSGQFLWDSIEEALQMERNYADIKKNIIMPGAAQMAQECDTRAARYAGQNAPNVIGAIGTTPASMDTYNGAMTRIAELGGWRNGVMKRAMFITAQMAETGITATVRALMNPADAVAKAFREGIIGRYSGYQFETSQSLYQHTTGIWATVASGVTINAANQSGSSITVACTTGDTFKKGDKISIGSTTTQVSACNFATRGTTNRARVFTITADTVGAGAVATLSIFPSIIGPGSPYQNVDQLPPNAAVVNLWPGTSMSNAASKSGPLGLFFTEDAFYCAGVKLPMPKGGTKEISQQYTDPDTKISISYIQDFMTKERERINRMDMMFGFGNGWAEYCSGVIGSAQ